MLATRIRIQWNYERYYGGTLAHSYTHSHIRQPCHHTILAAIASHQGLIRDFRFCCKFRFMKHIANENFDVNNWNILDNPCDSFAPLFFTRYFTSFVLYQIYIWMHTHKDTNICRYRGTIDGHTNSFKTDSFNVYVCVYSLHPWQPPGLVSPALRHMDLSTVCHVSIARHFHRRRSQPSSISLLPAFPS